MDIENIARHETRKHAMKGSSNKLKVTYFLFGMDNWKYSSLNK